MNIKYIIELTEEERAYLLELTSKGILCVILSSACDGSAMPEGWLRFLSGSAEESVEAKSSIFFQKFFL